MKIKCSFIFTLLFFTSCIDCRRTELDNAIEPFRVFKLFASQFLKSSTRSSDNLRNLRTNKRVQDYIDGPFPCSLNNSRSSSTPNSVHELRPGDIDIIGAIGDSLTAGFGLSASNPLHVLLEERGLSFSIGGENNWRSVLTIPNILKEFNPKLFGYSLGPSISIQKESQFNVAEGGAFSEEMPYMAKVLVQRIKNDPRVDLEKHWKMITVLIGANNFCTDICYRNTLEEALTEHWNDMLSVLRTFRDNLPRTIVNIVPPPHMKILAGFTAKPSICKITHSIECPCIVGLTYAKRQKQFYEAMEKWIEMDNSIANLPEFDLDDFAVVYQPFVVNYSFPLTENGWTDYSYMSQDCFHFSQKGNARVSNSLWNNILEPVGAKSTDGVDIMSKFNCPTAENPYIFTKRNSKLNRK